ncbi:MAG: 16S rRNA (uracil(1498)-N(3))-methyltransferase [Clostridia bacterium]|nr:16S rRNA (uracil(1498)-N(3))-methyltransferase [Clostridia bacterium]
MPRFFLSTPMAVGDTVTLTGDDAKHISFSLRMAAGEEVTLLDGDGHVYRARLTALDGTAVKAEILCPLSAEAESPVRIHLFQAYPKSDKLETIIQKAVELGVSAVTPFESERCIKRPKADKVAHVTERHNRIAKEAAGQSGRDRLPTVHAPISFSEMLKKAAAFPLCLFCYEGGGTHSLKEICAAHPDTREIAVVVGSEGGFSEREAEAAAAAGLAMTGLGKRILRCETAPLYALSALSFFYEL